MLHVIISSVHALGVEFASVGLHAPCDLYMTRAKTHCINAALDWKMYVAGPAAIESEKLC